MLIDVVLKDGTYEKVFRTEFNRLLDAKQVLAFKRDDGWAMVGRDRMRGEKYSMYHGPDRRHSQRKPLKSLIH